MRTFIALAAIMSLSWQLALAQPPERSNRPGSGPGSRPPSRRPQPGGGDSSFPTPPPRPSGQSSAPVTPSTPPAAEPASAGGARTATAQLLPNTWAGWRGNDASNVLAGASLPTTWSVDENIAWRADVPGYGWSSPIVIGDRIVLTTAVSANQVAPVLFGPGSGNFDPPNELVRFDVMCYELGSGKLLWQQTIAEKKPEFAIHSTNTYATETPVSDGKSIFVRFGEIGIACLDLEGHVKWRQDIGPYRMQGGWGTSSNPLLTEQGVILQVDTESTSYVTLLSKENGQPLWRVDRRERSAWSTPYLWRNSLRDEVVLIGAKSIRSYDPQSGRELWSLGATGQVDPTRRNDPAFEAGSCKASPAGTRDLLLVGKGNRAKAGSSQFGPFWAVKPGGSGDINLPSEAANETDIDSSKPKSGAFVQWYRNDAGPVIASPLIVDGLVYITPRNGSTFHCLDLNDGHTVYSQQLGREQYFFITPWSAGGYIYAASGRGKTFVFKTGPAFELVATNDLNENCYAAPALLNGAIIYRTATKLYCIGKPPAKPTPTAEEMAAKSDPSSLAAPSAARDARGGRQSSNRLVEFALAIEDLSEQQRSEIQRLATASREREADATANSNVPRAAERIRDDLRRGIEALLNDAQKKTLRTRLAEGSGDPGAANGGPITTLREQLSKVGLTEQQDFQVQSLVLQLRDDIGKAVRDTTQSRGSAIRNITEEYKQKITALLTDEQREKLRQLQRRP